MVFTLDSAKSETIDRYFRDYLAETPYWPGKVLLDYSLGLHQAWRSTIPLLPIGEGMRLLDVGTGYGLLADELIANLRLTILGIDIDPQYVDGARDLHAALSKEGVFISGSKASFEEGDICDLPCPDASFEFIMVREVYQFIADTDKATSELMRATVPGGFVCVSDNDDGFFITYPESSEAFRSIHQAVDREQNSYGGDRQVGRKLSTMLSQGGFDILAVSAMPESRHWTVTADDPERLFLIEQMKEAKARVVACGAANVEDYDRWLSEFEEEQMGERFRFNARILVVGRKPAA